MGFFGISILHTTHMAAVLGKRKRLANQRTQSPSTSSLRPSDTEHEDERDVFRRAFEAKFKPLDGTLKHQNDQVEGSRRKQDQEEQDESDWEGFESEDDTAVRVIEHNTVLKQDPLSKTATKAFMVSIRTKHISHSRTKANI